MFIDATTAGRIEAAELALTVACARAFEAKGGRVSIREIGSGAVIAAGAGSPFSKAVGLGFSPLDEAALAVIEEEHADRGEPLRVELSTLAPQSPAEVLTRRGYVLIGFENVLGRVVEATAAAGASAIEVAPIRPDEVASWIDTVVEGFLHPDTVDGPPPTESFPRELLVKTFTDLNDVTELERFLAWRDGAVAGGGSLACLGGVALLAGAATLPAHRRRGVQKALLTARLARAAAAGCDLAVVTTQPGSPSHANVQRQGFALLYCRAVLIWSPPRGAHELT